MESGKSNKRAPNFSNREKSVLLNIISDFKGIIENKTTDAHTWRDKSEAWDQVTRIFNARSVESYPRTKECLRKYYDNIKKNLRKQIADEKIAIKETGGGPEEIVEDPIKNLALNIINVKTVRGLSNPFDGDHYEEVSSASCSYNICDNDIEITELKEERETPMKENIKNAINCANPSNSKTKANSEDHAYTKNQLTLQISSDSDIDIPSNKRHKTYKENTNPKNADWGKIAASQLKTPISEEIKHRWTKRRRPKLQVPPSMLVQEYSELAKLKKEVYEAEKTRIERQSQYDEEIFQLTKQKLKLEIEFKGLQVKGAKKSLHIQHIDISDDIY